MNRSTDDAPPECEPVQEPARSAREQRQRVVSGARRDLILAAARSAFLELGLEGVSMREIARRAGYTAGALYTYFPSKEDVYAALLGESLARLNQRISAAQEGAGGRAVAKAAQRRESESRLRAQARAFFAFYAENPRDLDLGFYLFHGMQPRGLTPELNEQLNARLRQALAPAQHEMLRLGLADEEAETEVTALFAHIVGLLVLSHTGRIRMFRREADTLFERYLDALVARCAAAARRRRAQLAAAPARLPQDPRYP